MAVEITHDPSDAVEEDVSPIPDVAPQEKRFRIPQPLQLAIVLFLGLGVGAYIIHKHDSARVPVAVVNSEVIDKTTFAHELEDAGGAGTLKQMVSEELDLQYAQRLGLQPSPKEINDRYDELIAYPVLVKNFLTGQSEWAAKRALAVQMAQLRVATAGITATNAEAKKFYADNTNPLNPNAEFFSPETLTMSVIETKKADDIQKAFYAINVNQEPFEEVARQYSQDAAASEGGQFPPAPLGQTTLHTISPSLEKKVFSLKVDQVYGPVQFKGMWIIVKCDDKGPSSEVPYEDVKDLCIEGAKVSKVTHARANQIQSGFESFQKSATIRIIDPDYKDTVIIGK